MERAANTKGLIVDIRNYPSEFVPFALGQYFVDKPTMFARFTIGDLSNPGGFEWSPEVALQPMAPRRIRCGWSACLPKSASKKFGSDCSDQEITIPSSTDGLAPIPYCKDPIA